MKSDALLDARQNSSRSKSAETGPISYQVHINSLLDILTKVQSAASIAQLVRDFAAR